MKGLEERGIGFKSLTENIDTTTSGGKLIFHIFGALAEFERNLIRERTQAGLSAARARGKRGGRPKALRDSAEDWRKRPIILRIVSASRPISSPVHLTFFSMKRQQLRP
jgi:DNA invertase Pin-like site-specific DNA recombinase